MTRSEEYNSLRSLVLKSSEDYLQEDHLKILLVTFQQVIKSKRRSSYINNFNDLIAILEKRGHIGDHSVEPLKQIVDLIPNQNVSNRIMNNFQAFRHRSRNEGAYTSSGNTSLPFYSPDNSIGSAGSRRSNTINNNNALPEAVVNLVCGDIGTHWRDLARNLSIREGDIDEIEVLHPRQLKERAYECMKRFQKETDPDKAQLKLLHALEKCGRKDIKEGVEELLSRRSY
ncbi:fas-associated death domain protein [Periplaneta americana]|uniref:fas-associated death domain protein n=1 Tax=Periplaneta americana TaxID=6978 RepID=UPI0037E90EF5